MLRPSTLSTFATSRVWVKADDRWDAVNIQFYVHYHCLDVIVYDVIKAIHCYPEG